MVKKLIFCLFLTTPAFGAGNIVINQGSGGGSVVITSPGSSGGGISSVVISTLTTGATNFVYANSTDLQSGSTFYVSSGSVQGKLTVNGQLNNKSLFTNGVFETSGSAIFYGADNLPTLYVNDEESGLGIDSNFSQNVTLFAGLAPQLTIENGAVSIQNAGFQKFLDSDNSSYTALRSSYVLTSDNIYVLPSSSGTVDQAIVTDGRNNLSFKGVILNQNSLQSGASFFVLNGAATSFTASTISISNSVDQLLNLTRTSAAGANKNTMISFYQDAGGGPSIVNTIGYSNTDFPSAAGSIKGFGVYGSSTTLTSGPQWGLARNVFPDSLKMRLYNYKGDGYVSFETSNTLTGALDFILPSADGGSGYVLTTDGNKNLYFAETSGGITTISSMTTGATNFILNQNTLQSGATAYINRLEVSGSNGIVLSTNTNSPSFKTTLALSTPTANRLITIPNASGTIAVSATSPIAVSAAGNLSLTNPLPIANGGTNNTSAYTNRAVIFSNGTSLTQDSAGFNYNSTTDNLGLGATNSSAAILALGASTTLESGINFGKGVTPTLPNDGDVWFTSDTNSINTYSTDMISPIASMVASSTATVTYSNTSSTKNLTLTGTVLGIKTIPASGVSPGKVFKIESWGVLSTDSVASTSITFNLLLGTITVNTASLPLTTGLSSAPWTCRIVGTVRNSTSAGNFISQGKCTYFDGSSDVSSYSTNSTPIFINWSTTNAVSFISQFADADIDNIVSMTNYFLEYGY